MSKTIKRQRDPNEDPNKTYLYEAQAWTKLEYFIRSGHVFLGLGTVQLFGLLAQAPETQQMEYLTIGLGTFAIAFGVYLKFKAQQKTRWQRKNLIRDFIFSIVIVALAALTQNAVGLMMIYAFAMATPFMIWFRSAKLVEAAEQEARERIKEKQQRTNKQISKTRSQQEQSKQQRQSGFLKNMSRAERKKYRARMREENK